MRVAFDQRVSWRRTRAGTDAHERRGIFLILAAIVLTVILAFCSLAVDLGFMVLTKQRMQNAVDAAALAASLEITNAINNAPAGTLDVTGYALGQARTVAAQVANINGVYVNSQTDVIFGKRAWDDSLGRYTITWNATPANVVKVIARRDDADTSQPDGQLKLFFAGVNGTNRATVRTEASAFVESRDIVIVHDFSRSMNFDSYFNNEANATLSDVQVLNNLALTWGDLQMPNTGTLPDTGQFLQITSSSNDVSATVEFRHDDAIVNTTGELSKVIVEYDNGNRQTFSSVSGNSATIDGYRDIDDVEVYVLAEEGAPVTLTNNGIEVEFSGDRETADIDSPNNIREIYAGFTDGSDDYVWLGNSGPQTYSYDNGKEIDYLYLELLDGRSFWYYFEVPGGPATLQIDFHDTNNAVKNYFQLTNPWPYASGSWDGYINHARDYDEFDSRNLNEYYGGLTLTNYLLKYKSSYHECKDLWKTRHYPFHAIKLGHNQFCDHLASLGFDDHIGMVSYDTNHRMEMTLNDPDPNIPNVDVSNEPITDQYSKIKDLMWYKQASHYSNSTNMGGGLKDGIAMLGQYARPGSRETIVLMTDGNTNTMDSGESGTLPGDWDWDAYFDYDGDGSGDYYTNSSHKRYVLKLAKQAKDADIMVHTISVGQDADSNLMKAIAHIGEGLHVDVPGGTTVTDMENQLAVAFTRIATFVPPATLLPDE